MKWIPAVIFCLIIKTGTAQFDFAPWKSISRGIDFVSDTAPLNPNAVGDRYLDSVYGTNQTFDFQWRLWCGGLTNLSTKVFVMSLSGDAWTARYFYANPGWQKDRMQFKEGPVDQKKLPQLWYKLSRSNLLTIPPERSLVAKETTFSIDTAGLDYSEGRLIVLDGLRYRFELLKPFKQRYFSYGNPRIYFQRYPYLEELCNVVLIIMLVERYVGISFEK